MIELESDSPESKSAPHLTSVSMRAVGIGGAGCNILSRLNPSSGGIESVAISTSRQDLERCKVRKKLQLGGKLNQFFLGSAVKTVKIAAVCY
ncbi:hypothetical protein ES703_50814 [subsurface metagenome]